jgi:hypothetical protein
VKRVSAILLAVVLSVAFITSAYSAEPQQEPAEAGSIAPTVITPCQQAPWAKYRRAVKRAWRYSVGGYGGDYHAGSKPSQQTRQRIGKMRRQCTSEQRQAKMWRHVSRRKQQWRFHRYIDRITVYGEWVIPPYIVACESGYNYRRWNTASTSYSRASGAYQDLRSTWLAFGGGRYADVAAYAPPWAQHIVNHKVKLGQGLGAWECA